MEKIANWELNRTDEKGNIISGYQDRAENCTMQQAITDYLYYLKTSEGIEDPHCDCVEIDCEEEEEDLNARLCQCGSGVSWVNCPSGSLYCG